MQIVYALYLLSCAQGCALQSLQNPRLATNVTRSTRTNGSFRMTSLEPAPYGRLGSSQGFALWPSATVCPSATLYLRFFSHCTNASLIGCFKKIATERFEE
jgi:hypothetical protein